MIGTGVRVMIPYIVITSVHKLQFVNKNSTQEK